MELRFDESGKFAVIEMSGSLDRETVLRALDAVVADARYCKGMGRLWDFRAADLSSLDSATVAEMAQYTRQFPPGINDVKVAFATSRDLEFGLSRVFEMSSRAATSIRVFRSLEEAEEWLAE